MLTQTNADVLIVDWQENNETNPIGANLKRPTHLVPSLAGALDLMVVALRARRTRPRALPQEEEGAAVAGSRRAPTAAGERASEASPKMYFFLRCGEASSLVPGNGEVALDALRWVATQSHDGAAARLAR